MIPLKQTIEVLKASGELDVWGEPTETVIQTHACRIDYKTEVIKLMKDRGEGEAISTASILIKGLVEFSFSDVIKWTDENGLQFERRPLAITVLRDFGGKPLFTKVSV